MMFFFKLGCNKYTQVHTLISTQSEKYQICFRKDYRNATLNQSSCFLNAGIPSGVSISKPVTNTHEYIIII